MEEHKDKELDLQLQDSSDVILQQREREDMKVYNLDDVMGMDLNNGADETHINFYAQQSIENENIPLGKKKKKKKGFKKRNLFRDDD